MVVGSCVRFGFKPLEAAVRRRTEGPRMDERGSILVTGAAGQLGAVGRMVTGLLLDRGLPVRAMVRREDDRRRRCGSLAPRWWSEIYSNRLTSIGSSAAVGGSTSVCPCPPGITAGVTIAASTLSVESRFGRKNIGLNDAR